MKKLNEYQVAVVDLFTSVLATIGVIAVIPFALSSSNVEGSGGGFYYLIAPLVMLVFVAYKAIKKCKSRTQ